MAAVPPPPLPPLLLAAAVLWGASASPAAPADAPFIAAPTVGAGPTGAPSAVALGDFDSDGRQDLAIADYGGKRVLSRLGNGDGTFRDAGETTDVLEAQDLVVGDWNADGHEDLAVAAKVGATNTVGLLQGSGDGRFALKGRVAVPGGLVLRLAVGDFDGDAREDLATLSATQVNVRLGAGNGTFAGGDEQRFPGGSPRALDTGDFDGDGHEDLAVAVEGADVPHALTIVPGAGNGTFGPVRAGALPEPAQDLVVGDFDGDARDDVALAHMFQRRVRVRLGAGDGTFREPAAPLALSGLPRTVVVDDVNADGREDLAIAGEDDNRVSVRLGTGDGTFADGGSVAVGALSLALALGDLDADGRQDLVSADYDARGVSVRLGAGAPAPGEDLVVNGGFDLGAGARLPTQAPEVPGWERSGGMTSMRYGVTPSLGFPSWLDAARFQNGGRQFLWGGDSTGFRGVTSVTQVIDVSDHAEAIDAGRVRADLSAYLGGARAYPDRMGVAATFLPSGGVGTEALRLEPVTREERRNRTTLLRRAGSAAVPTGTRRIRLTVTSTDTDTVSSAMADNVRLVLDVAPPSSVPPAALPAGTPAVAAPGPVSGPLPTPAASRFGRLVRVSLAARRPRTTRTVEVVVANANPFEITGVLGGRATDGRRSLELAARPFTVGATGRRTVSLRLPAALRRRLADGRRLTLRLTTSVADPARTRRTLRKAIVVRPPVARRGR